MSTSARDLATLRLLLATLQPKIGNPEPKIGNPAWQPRQKYPNRVLAALLRPFSILSRGSKDMTKTAPALALRRLQRLPPSMAFASVMPQENAVVV